MHRLSSSWSGDSGPVFFIHRCSLCKDDHDRLHDNQAVCTISRSGGPPVHHTGFSGPVSAPNFASGAHILSKPPVSTETAATRRSGGSLTLYKPRMRITTKSSTDLIQYRGNSPTGPRK